MMKFHAKDVQFSCSGGDGFQAYFSESKAGRGAYVLLQNYFEFERGPAYFECGNHELAGHGRVKSCEIHQNSLEIDLKDSTEHITVTFDEPDEKIGQMVWILDIVFAGHVRCVNSSGISEIPIEDPDDDMLF